MTRYRGRWTARVDQEFDVEAENEDDARDLVAEEMNPRNVVELYDMDIEELEEVRP